MSGRRDGDIIIRFQPLCIVADPHRVGKEVVLITGIVVADAVLIVLLSRGNQSPSADAYAAGPIHRIGVMIGEAEAGEKTDPFVVRDAVAGIDGLVVRVSDQQIRQPLQ